MSRTEVYSGSNERSPTEADAPTRESKQEGLAVAMVKAMLRSGQPQPQRMATVLQQHLYARNEIMLLLNTTVGMAFAKAVMALAESSRQVEVGNESTTSSPSASCVPLLESNAGQNAARSAGQTSSDTADWSAPRTIRVTASDSLNVREAAGMNGGILGVVSTNEELEAIGQDGEWYKVHYKGRVAFVNAAFAALVTNSAHTVVEPNEESPIATQAPTIPSISKSPDTTAASTKSVPANTGASSAPAPISAPAETHADAAAALASGAATTSYLSGYTSLGGTNVAYLRTTRSEAETLNALRKSDKRFDPVWLAAAQKNGLGVVATGSFNTETLRALHKLHPKLDAAGIISDQGGALSSLAPGTPFVNTDPGLGTADKKSMVGATKADRAAHALGYSDYDTYYQMFSPATLLGVQLNVGGCRSRSDVEKREQFRSLARSCLRYGATMRQISGYQADLCRKEPRDDQYRRSRSRRPECIRKSARDREREDHGPA